MYKIILPILALSLFGCDDKENISHIENKPTISISEKENQIELQFREFLKNPNHKNLVESDRNFITIDELKEKFSIPERKLTISSKYYELEKFVFNAIKISVSVKHDPKLEQFDIVYYSETPMIITHFGLMDIYEDELINPLKLFNEGRLNSTDLKYYKSSNKAVVFKNGKLDFEFEKKSKIKKHTVNEMFYYRLDGMDISEAKEEIEKSRSNLNVIKEMISEKELVEQNRIIDKAYSSVILRENLISGLSITDLKLSTNKGYYFISFNWKSNDFYDISSITCYLEYLNESGEIIGFEDVHTCFYEDLISAKVGTRSSMIQNIDAAQNSKSLNIKIKEIRFKE